MSTTVVAVMVVVVFNEGNFPRFKTINLRLAVPDGRKVKTAEPKIDIHSKVEFI